jgi:hypothetical protein
MKNLVSYKLYEASTWWEEKIADYDFDLPFVKDICQDLIDEGMSVIIKPYFMNRKFNTISKKTDALESNFYCGYSIYISNMRFPSDVTGFIECHNLIFNTLRQLQSNFECKVVNYSGSIHVYCIDLTLPFDSKTIDFKGKKAEKLKAELIVSNLSERQSKILKAKIVSDDTIEVTPKIDIDRVEEILHKVFQKFHKDFIKIYQIDGKIIIKII